MTTFLQRIADELMEQRVKKIYTTTTTAAAAATTTTTTTMAGLI